MTFKESEKVTQAVTITAIDCVNAGIWIVHLAAIENETIQHFFAGQYLKIILPDKRSYAYSIASSPKKTQSLELHIQCYSNHSSAEQVIQYLTKSYNEKAPILIELPFGQCFLKDRHTNQPLVFIASGTGFAQSKSIIEHHIDTYQQAKNLHLYWSVRRPTGFYLPELPKFWSKNYQLNYHPVASEPISEDDWTGRFGLLDEVIIQDIDKFQDAYFFISASPEMVYSTLDGLVKVKNIAANRVLSDVFEYAPRE